MAGDGFVQSPSASPTGTQDPLLQLIQQAATQNANQTGMTDVRPQVPQHQVQQPQPFQPQPQQPIRPVGPGQGGAMKQQQMQNFATSLRNTVGSVVNAVESRKARQQQKIFDNFALYAKGRDDAQSAIQQARQQQQEAMAALKANPSDASQQQKFLQAKQAEQKAQQSLQSNTQNLNDLTSGKNEKNVKILQKGYGIDDKNAGTPERQMAINAYKKANAGVNDQVASIMSKLPQTQQLTPEAQGRSMATQAGVTGKPATGSSVLNAATKYQAMKAAQEQQIQKRKEQFIQGIPKLEAAGYSFDKDANGQPQFDAQGFPKVHVLTTEERDKNPQMAAKNDLMQSVIDLNKAKKAALTDPNNPKLKADIANAQARLKNAYTVNAGDAKEIASGIERGDLPPTLRSLYRNAAGVEAQLARDHFDLAKAESDWNATQKYLQTLNGPQQVRLRQAVAFTRESLPLIDDLYSKWLKTGLPTGFSDFNYLALKAAKKLPGEAGDIATNLERQINDLTSELGTVYKGGNSSTDESLKLAASNLKGEWNSRTFHDAMEMIDKNLAIRENSMKNSTPLGVSEAGRYYNQPEEGMSDDDLLKELDNAQPPKPN